MVHRSVGYRVKIERTKVEGCLSIVSGLFQDNRGDFMETWNRGAFMKLGLPIDWPQDNISSSRDRVLRGLHVQRMRPQGKLVRCLRGAIWDVCVDVRKDSPTFLQWHAELLTGCKALYCPPGTAHGFLALEPDSLVYYKCTTLYDKDSDGGVNPFDQELNIPWPSRAGMLSSKDKDLPSLREWLAGG